MDKKKQIKNLTKKNFSHKNSNYSYSILPSLYHKLYNSSLNNVTSKISRNIVGINNKNILGKSKNLNGNNCIIKNGLNSQKNKNINNYTINNRPNDIIYNNLYFSLNNLVSNFEIGKKVKPNDNNINNNINDKFSTILIEKKHNLLKIKPKNNLAYKNANTNTNINSNKINLKVLNLNKNKIIKKLKVNLKNRKLKNLSMKYINTNNDINNTNSIYTFPTPISENYDYQDNENNNKTTKNNIYKKLKLREINTKPQSIDRAKTPLNDYSLTQINPYIKIENNNIKTKKVFNYIENKKNILKSIEIEKQNLIEESYKNYKKYQYLIKKQQQEYKEYDKFLKKELNNNNRNQLNLQTFNNSLQKDGVQSYFKLVKRNRNNNRCLTNDTAKEKNKLLDINNYLNYNKNVSLKKSIQKYFVLKNNEDKTLKDKNNFLNENKHLNYIDSNGNNNLKLNKSNNINELKLNIKILKYIQNKVYNNKFKSKNLSLNKIDISPFNKTGKINKTAKSVNNSEKFNKYNNLQYKNIPNNNTFKIGKKQKKRLILKNKNEYIKNTKEKRDINNETLNNNKCPNLSVKIKYKSLSKLEDYIGPNQYGSLVIPTNNRKKIYRMISEEKERTLKRVRNMFEIMENKRNTEYYSQTKNREIKDLDEYYNKKDFDRIILSSEKESKYNSIKNKIYSEAFKPIKYEFIKN